MPNNVKTTSSPQLWITRVGEKTQQLEQKTISLLRPSEKRRLNATKSIHKKREYLLSRALMRHVFSQKFNIPLSEWDFIEKPNSAPVISNLQDKTCFSLSHSKGYICFVISERPIGIDIEAINTQRNLSALADIFMSDEERNYLLNTNMNADEQEKYFYRIWCAKEAYYKALNTLPDQREAQVITMLPILQTLKDDNWNISEFLVDSSLLSIISTHEISDLTINLFHSNLNIAAIK